PREPGGGSAWMALCKRRPARGDACGGGARPPECAPRGVFQAWRRVGMYTLSKSGSETLVSNLKGGDFAAPRASTLANGQFRVVWEGEGDSTRERAIGADGAPVGADTLRSSDRVLVTPLDGGGTFTLTDGGISGNYFLETSSGGRFGGTLFINSGG